MRLIFMLLLTTLVATAAGQDVIRLSEDGLNFVDSQGQIFVPICVNVPMACHLEPPGADAFGLRGVDIRPWIAAMAADGVNAIHLRLDMIRNVGLLNYDCPPLGRYYIADRYPIAAEHVPRKGWVYHDFDQSALVDGSEGDFAHRVRQSLLTRILQACEAEGVRVMITFFGSEQYDTHSRTGEESRVWQYMAYNRNAILATGEPVDPNHCGPIETGRDFCDPRIEGLLDAQKAFITFVIETWGESEAIYLWEIGNEMHFVPEMGDDVEATLVAWHAELAAHIRTLDPLGRAVTSSSVRMNDFGAGVVEIPDPADIDSEYERHCARMARMFDTLDAVNIHDYALPGLADRARVLRQMRQLWPGQIAMVGEYYPDHGRDVPIDQRHALHEQSLTQRTNRWPYFREFPPFRNSTAYSWVSFVASGGGSVAMRWEDYGLTSWDRAAALPQGSKYALGHTWQPYVPLARALGEIDLTGWAGHEDWTDRVRLDHYIDRDGAFTCIATGDGDQVMLLARSENPGATRFQVRSLDPGRYRATLIDWLSGRVIERQGNLVARDGRIEFAFDLNYPGLDREDLRYDERLGRFVGRLVEQWDPLMRRAGFDDWVRQSLVDPRPGQENAPANRHRRNLGFVWVERE